jgi:hypothetical protein
MKTALFLELVGSIILIVVCVVALYRMRSNK